MQVLSVAEVAGYIGSLLKADPLLSDVWVRGELANLSRSPSGHSYFALRSEGSQLRCVLFRGAAARLSAPLEAGEAVVVHGRADYYAAGGSLQLVVDLVFPEGVGPAQLELEALKLRLEAEGLFAPERKRPLPIYPRRIGLVTSEAGAVLHDILTVLQRRYPLVEVVLASASVQGARAPTEICAALDRLARFHWERQPLDAIIVARGGGDAQELAVFNDEMIARAIFGCPVPVVSAIGHETDFTLADFVADLRAPTPSAAAELVAPNRVVLSQAVDDLERRASVSAAGALAAAQALLETELRRLLALSPRIEVDRQRAAVSWLEARARSAAHQTMKLAREQLAGRLLQLEALSPAATLGRGYAVCQNGAGELITSVRQAPAGAELEVLVVDGSIESRVVSSRSGQPEYLAPEHGAAHGA
jgi:exodeoxyribonuclease VII large subunit